LSDSGVVRRRRSAFGVGWTAVFLFAVGCSGQDADLSMVRSFDPELARAAAELLPGLAERSGLEMTAAVRVERRTRVELERYLRYKLEERLPADEAEWVSDVYRMLGLVPDDFDLREVLLELYLEQVVGFYDPDSTTLFVIDDQSPAVLEPLLMHELVHAIQDQVVDLDSITDPDLGNDRTQAAAAAIEGHATLVMFEYALERTQGVQVDLREIDDFAEQFRPALETLQGQSPALARAPRIVRETLLFPYFGGASFVEALWKGVEGRPAPFGANLPASTEQVLHLERFLDRDEPSGIELEIPVGWSSLYEDPLGELELQIFLDTHLGPRGEGMAAGWDGDRYALIAGASGAPALVWASVWDDVAGRDRLVSALSTAGSLPEGARVEAVGIDGRPGIRLSIGKVPAVPARIVPAGEP
jgi:hypothetical protein